MCRGFFLGAGAHCSQFTSSLQGPLREGEATGKEPGGPDGGALSGGEGQP